MVDSVPRKALIPLNPGSRVQTQVAEPAIPANARGEPPLVLVPGTPTLVTALLHSPKKGHLHSLRFRTSHASIAQYPMESVGKSQAKSRRSRAGW